MVFSSAIFLFVFFPTVFILYNLMPSLKIKNYILTVASLIFYSFGQPKYLLLLLISVVLNYIAGVFLCKEGKHRKLVLVISVVLNIGMLSVFKYLDFALENINAIFHTTVPLPGIVLPIGISFFTFQGMSYVIDVYRERHIGTKNFGKLLLYISFFPQLIAGPIVKYHDVALMIDNRHSSIEGIAKGLRRFVIGLSKKLLLANATGALADQVFSLSAEGLDMRIAWVGAICYSLQIYYDFSGYSDMAIGMGHIFGFTFLENFDHPYVATTIQDFWRRWHISLSSWFRDYLYIPLGGSYCSKGRGAFNKIVVFFTTGLWHGASWTFIFWGMWHGMFQMAETMGIIPQKKLRGKLIGHIYTLMVVMLGFVLFRAETFAQAGLIFSKMFTGFQFTAETNQIFHDMMSNYNIVMIILAIILSADWMKLIRKKIGIKDERVFETAEQEAAGLASSGFAIPINNATKYSCDSSANTNICMGKKAIIFEVISYIAIFALFIYNLLNLSQATFNPFIYFQF